MDTKNKIVNTGSPPYHLEGFNTSNQISHFPDQTNPLFGFLELMNNTVIIQEEFVIIQIDSDKTEE